MSCKTELSKINLVLSCLVFLCPWFSVTVLPSKFRNWRLWKTLFSFKLPIFRHLNSIRCKHSAVGIKVIIYYRHCTTTKTEVQRKLKFSLLWEFFKELWNLPSWNIPFFQNANSWSLMNTIILTVFSSCKHRHQYYYTVRHHSNFQILIFLGKRACMTSRCCTCET